MEDSCVTLGCTKHHRVRIHFHQRLRTPWYLCPTCPRYSPKEEAMLDDNNFRKIESVKHYLISFKNSGVVYLIFFYGRGYSFAQINVAVHAQESVFLTVPLNFVFARQRGKYLVCSTKRVHTPPPGRKGTLGGAYPSLIRACVPPLK
jgi:hypothetical protein